MELYRGQKKPIREIIPKGPITITIDYFPTDINIIAFGLDANHKINDNRYAILFGNRQSPNNAITLDVTTGCARFTIDIDRLPLIIERIIFTATHEIHAIGKTKKLQVIIGETQALYNAKDGLNTEKTIIMMELYRHQNTWRLGIIGQGFNGGLNALITHFTDEVTRPSLSQFLQTLPSPASIDNVSSTISQLNLNKITLEKKQSINLTKKTTTFEEIKINLNWSRNSTTKRGFFGKLIRDRAVDLDLGCLYVLKNGKKGVVQALGKTFGNLNHEPYIYLLGDDRTGDNTSGETILINGKFFDKIDKIAIFAYIYDGVPNWNETNGTVSITTPKQPPLEVKITEGSNNKTMCGIALIENDQSQMKVSRLVEYFKDHEAFANSIGIFLRWVTATKD